MSNSHSDTRAPRDEIFLHLSNLLDEEAVQIAKEAAELGIAGQNEQ